MLALTLTMLALLGAAAQADTRARQNPTGTASVSGMVLRADSSTPLARASVRLMHPGGGVWVADTDTSGRFEFKGLPAGRFTVTARKPAYVTINVALPDSAQSVRFLEVKPGQAVQDLVIRMSRGGAVNGRIVDDTGEPVVEAHVRALRAEYLPGGGRRLSAQQSVQANDLGQFRLYGLPPGKYYVTAAYRSIDLANYDAEKPPEVTRGGTGFAPTFYPGTVVAADAQPVIVAAGEEVPAVDFAMRAVRLARVSGIVVDSRGRPASDAVVMLNPTRTGGASVSGQLSVDFNVVEVAADGSFVLSHVRPGEYRLDVQPKAAFEEIAQTGRSGLSQTANREYGSVPVVASGDDIEHLRVVTSPGHRLSGRVVVKGATADPEVLQKMRISTVDLQAGLALSAVLFGAGGAVRADGTFEVRGVTGTRAVRVYGLPPGWALESVRLSGSDVTDEGVEIRGSDIADVDVVLTARPSQITGTVADGLGRPVPNSAVIVFAEARGRWEFPASRHVLSAVAGTDGTFTVSPLPAGTYYVAVVDALVDGEWAEPENLDRLRAAAVRITLQQSESKQLTLRRESAGR